MARPAPRESRLSSTIPASVAAWTAAASCVARSAPAPSSAAGRCSPPAEATRHPPAPAARRAKAGPVSFGMNEAKGSGPAYERLQAMADAYAKKTGVTVSSNAVDHNTFQESINTYLQGTPDDVFTWFAGYRMSQFAEDGLITDISDVWPIDGMGDAFKKSSTAPDGKQYFVPVSYYPWAVFYRKSVFEKNGWTEPTTMDELKALMKDMQGKKITPFAFAAKDAWAPDGDVRHPQHAAERLRLPHGPDQG